jgi:hypothetical protein
MALQLAERLDFSFDGRQIERRIGNGEDAPVRS